MFNKVDVLQAFDKVWHESLIYKMDKLVSELLQSYIVDRKFRVAFEEARLKSCRYTHLSQMKRLHL